jgi:hypothetical protein
MNASLPPPRRQVIQARRDEIFRLRGLGYSHLEISRMITPPVTPQRIGQVLRKPRLLKVRKHKNTKKV